MHQHMNLGDAKRCEILTLSEDHIFSTRVYKKIPIRDTNRATALIDWESRKWPFERYAELDSTAVARCLMCGVFSSGVSSTTRGVVMSSGLGVIPRAAIFIDEYSEERMIVKCCKELWQLRDLSWLVYLDNLAVWRSCVVLTNYVRLRKCEMVQT